jgi:hypothetical protein
VRIGSYFKGKSPGRRLRKEQSGFAAAANLSGAAAETGKSTFMQKIRQKTLNRRFPPDAFHPPPFARSLRFALDLPQDEPVWSLCGGGSCRFCTHVA